MAPFLLNFFSSKIRVLGFFMTSSNVMYIKTLQNILFFDAAIKESS